MEAIILTYAPVEGAEKEILAKTKIFKIALNQHAEEFRPNARIITDYILSKVIKRFPEKVISLRDRTKFPPNRVEYSDLKFKGSTILAALDYLISNGFDKILIIGDNKVNNLKFRNVVNEEIGKLKGSAEIFQYSDGNFNLPCMSITDFCKNIKLY